METQTRNTQSKDTLIDSQTYTGRHTQTDRQTGWQRGREMYTHTCTHTRTCGAVAQQHPAQLALEGHSGVVSIGEDHEPFASIGPLEAQHVQAAQAVVRRLVQHDAVLARRGHEHSAADLFKQDTHGVCINNLVMMIMMIIMMMRRRITHGENI
jgi:hypothetical protein